MSASTGDKITDVRNSARPVSTTVSSGRSSGATTLACASLTGWPTASKVHFVTYQVDSNSNPVSGSQLDCYGIVSGNNINSLAVVDGTDNGNSIGDVVEMLPTAAWGQDLADALTNQHTRTGTHSAITTTSISNAGTLAQTGVATFTAVPVLPASTITTANIQANAVTSAKIASIALDNATLSNPYKFSVYRNGALSIATSQTKITFDTELFDTNNNFDSVTNNRYVAPVNGFYQFNMTVNTGSSGASTSRFLVDIYVNGSGVYRISDQSQAGSTHYGAAGSLLIQLTATDYVEVFAQSVGQATAITTGQQTSFMGFLVSQT